MRLKEYLDTYIVEQLKPLAAFCGYSKVTLKSELTRSIIGEMTAPEGLRRQWDQLDDLSKKAVSHAVHNGGLFDPLVFLAQYEQLPQRPRSTTYWQPAWIRLDLFIHQGRVPDDLIPLLEPWVPRPEPFKITGAKKLPKRDDLDLEMTEADTEHTGPRDLAAVLRLIDAGQIQVSASTQMPTAASVKKILAALSQGDFFEAGAEPKATDTIRPVGLTIFAVGSGLAELPKGLTTAKPELTETGRAWLRSQDPELLLEAFERWTQEGRFDELTRIRVVRGQGSRVTQLTRPASRRERVVEALSWCPVGEWINVEDFFRGVLVWQFDFDVEATQYANLYVGSRDFPLDAASYWRAVKGLYILAVLWEFIAAVGGLDIAYVDPEDADYDLGDMSDYFFESPSYSLYDGLRYFRVNDLGAYLLGQHAEYSAPGAKRPCFLQIAPDLVIRITAPDVAMPADRLAVQAVATPLDENSYRVDLESLLFAVEQERDLKADLEYLQEWNAGPVPKGLTDLFADAIARGNAFAAPEDALTIEVHNANLAHMAVADPKLKRLCRLAGDRTLVIAANRERAVRNRLRELGYVLPKK